MALSFTILSLALLMSQCLSSMNGENQEQFTFAKCEPNREECRDCYFSLVKSLLGKADNVFNLINAFSPPGKNEPEYVIVTYHFDNDALIEEKNWFWSKSVAYYLFPMDVLQMLSLFLSKGDQRYQQHVRVTLNATECWGVKNDYMTLLTQKVSHCQNKLKWLEDSYCTNFCSKVCVMPKSSCLFTAGPGIISINSLIGYNIIATVTVEAITIGQFFLTGK